MSGEAGVDITLPERVREREMARRMCEGVTSRVARVDATKVAYASAAFLDELVKLILIEGSSEYLLIAGLGEREAAYASSAAKRRGCAHRLMCATSPKRAGGRQELDKKLRDDAAAAARLRSLAAIYEQPSNRDATFTFTGRQLAAMLKEEG